MANETSTWTWASRIPITLIVAFLSAVIFFVQLDFDRKRLATQVMKIEAKQSAHVEEIVKLNEQIRGIDLRLTRIEQSQDKILDLLMDRGKLRRSP